MNYKTQDFAAEVKKVTDGKGVDVIVDFVGQSHWQKNIDSLAVDGHMTMLAFLSGKRIFFSAWEAVAPVVLDGSTTVPRFYTA